MYCMKKMPSFTNEICFLSCESPNNFLANNISSRDFICTALLHKSLTDWFIQLNDVLDNWALIFIQAGFMDYLP